MKKPILIFIVFCLLLMGVVVSADAGGRETDTGRWPYNTIPVALVDPDGNYVGISDQGNNGLLTVSVDYAHHETHECKHYSSQHNDTLANNGTIQFIMNTPAEPIQVHLLFLTRFSGEAHYNIYRAPSFSDIGTLHPIGNHNDLLECSGSSATEIYLSPTITGLGTLMPAWGDHLGAGQQMGGENRGTAERILRASTLYFINTVSEANSNDSTVELDYYEDSGDAP